jgi:predicted dehydrogenase
VFQRYHLQAIRTNPDLAIVGVCEPDPDRRGWAEAELPGAGLAASLAEWLAGDRADAVLVTAPPAAHAELVCCALDAGLSVLVEKPMTLTSAEAHRVRARQRASGRVLQVGFNRRYRPEYLRLRGRVTGRVQHIAFRFVADARQWNPGVAATPSFVLQDAGSHALDLVAHLAGRPVERVRAALDHSPGASVVSIDAELAGGLRARCTVGHASRYEEQLAVTEAGAVHRVVVAPSLLAGAKVALCKIARRPTPTAQSFQAQLAGFVAACRGKPDDVGARAADGLAAVAAVHAADQSLSLGGAWCSVAVDLPDPTEERRS